MLKTVGRCRLWQPSLHPLAPIEVYLWLCQYRSIKYFKSRAAIVSAGWLGILCFILNCLYQGATCQVLRIEEGCVASANLAALRGEWHFCVRTNKFQLAGVVSTIFMHVFPTLCQKESTKRFQHFVPTGRIIVDRC